jgi:hypothetical protein
LAKIAENCDYNIDPCLLQTPTGSSITDPFEESKTEKNMSQTGLPDFSWCNIPNLLFKCIFMQRDDREKVAAEQGCQIFVGTAYQNGKSKPNGRKIYQHLPLQVPQKLVLKYAIWQPWSRTMTNFTSLLIFLLGFEGFV